jgi:hypothetical protein
LGARPGKTVFFKLHTTMLAEGVPVMKPSGWQIGGLLATALVALAAAGCDTGSDVLSTGNSQVRVELVLAGDTVEDWDCIIFEFQNVGIRPLDGICGSDSANPGDLCLNGTDCDPGTGTGTCEGSYAGELVGNLGAGLSNGDISVPGNLLEGTCTIPNPQIVADPIILPPPLILPEGLYEIKPFNITNVGFYRSDGNVRRLCLNFTVEAALYREVFGEDPWRFELSPDEEKVLVFTLHADVLEASLTDGATGQQCLQLRNNIVDILTCDTCQGSAP